MGAPHQIHNRCIAEMQAVCVDIENDSLIDPR